MSFNDTMIALMTASQNAWNDGDIDGLDKLFDDDIIITIEPVTLSNTKIDPQKIKGREEAIAFLRNLRPKLPLRYESEYDPDKISKRMKYRKFFYEIKVYAYFECLVSEYGKYKEFHVLSYENVHEKKLTSFYVMRNILSYKIKSLFRKRHK